MSENKIYTVILPYVLGSWLTKTAVNALFAIVWTYIMLLETKEDKCKSTFIASQLAQYVLCNVFFVACLDDSFSLPIVKSLRSEAVPSEDSCYYAVFLSWLPASYWWRVCGLTLGYTLFFAFVPTLLLAVLGGQASFGCTAGVLLLTFYGGTVATATHFLLLCRAASEGSTCPVYFDYDTSSLNWRTPGGEAEEEEEEEGRESAYGAVPEVQEELEVR